jgi:hypothetical protein
MAAEPPTPDQFRADLAALQAQYVTHATDPDYGYFVGHDGRSMTDWSGIGLWLVAAVVAARWLA